MKKSHMEKENHAERAMRSFAVALATEMGWGTMPVTRFKIGNTENWKGYCYSTGHEIFVIVSSNMDVHPTEKDFWDSLVHELIHAYLCGTGWPMLKAFGHGKAFKNVAKEIAKKTNNQFSYKRIMK